MGVLWAKLWLHVLLIGISNDVRKYSYVDLRGRLPRLLKDLNCEWFMKVKGSTLFVV